MNSVRGIVGCPRAMARPSGQSERDLIREALATMPGDDMSARSRARCMARRVIAEVVAGDSLEDPVEVALAALRGVLVPDAVCRLSERTADDLARERLRRFEARGCKQIPADAWQAETQTILSTLEKRLSEKFRRA